MDDYSDSKELNTGNLIYNIKLTPPVMHGNIIHRENLFQTLKKGLYDSPKFTLIAAALGYGKTTLVADWVERLGIPYVWITLSAEDNDPILLLQYISIGIKEINEEIGLLIDSIIGSPQLPSPSHIGSLLSEWLSMLTQPLPLIIDDYHVIGNQEIHRMLTVLLKSLPRNLNLILLTREDPPFVLGRLRVTNQLLELRAKDLEFNKEEIRDFLLHITSRELTEAMLEVVSGKTEGWAASLQLIALSIQQSSDKQLQRFIEDFDGTNQHIIDYLLEEVLQDRSSEELDFLYKSALFDSFCAPLCDCIREAKNSETFINKLKKDNLFIITLDPKQKWYRYHNLFAGFMKSHLEREDMKQIYAKAFHWFQAAGLNSDAIKYGLLAENFTPLINLLKKEAHDSFINGEISSLLNWLDALPENILFDDIELFLYKSWALFLTNRKKEFHAFMAQQGRLRDDLSLQGRYLGLQALLETRTDLTIQYALAALDLLDSWDVFFRLLAQIPLSHAYYREGKTDKAAVVLREAYNRSRETGNFYLASITLHNLAFLLNETGQKKTAEQYCHQIITDITAIYGENTPLSGLIYIPLATLYYESNLLNEAYDLAVQGLELCKSLNMDYILVEKADIILALIQVAQGNTEEAMSILDHTEIDLHHIHFSRSYEVLDCLEVEIAIKNGNVQKMNDWSRSFHQHDSQSNTIIYERKMLTFIRYLLYNREFEAAKQSLLSMAQRDKEKKRNRNLITVYLLLARLYLLQEQEDKARDFLTLAVTLAEPGEYIRAFLNEGKKILNLLPEIRNSAPRFVDKILKNARKTPQKVSTHKTLLKEELSKRELEILKCINEGYSNKEIGERLFISTGTVKWHINNILSKLNVKSRTQAIYYAHKNNFI